MAIELLQQQLLNLDDGEPDVGRRRVPSKFPDDGLDEVLDDAGRNEFPKVLENVKDTSDDDRTNNRIRVIEKLLWQHNIVSSCHRIMLIPAVVMATYC